MEPIDDPGEFEPGELEQLARSIIDDGLATSELRLAVDQLVADRANGERLDDALHRLRRALAA